MSKKIDYDALSQNDQKLLADKLCQEQKTGNYDGLVELFQFYLKIFLAVARKIAYGFGIHSDEHILDYVYDFRLEFLKGKIRNNEPKYIICGFRGDSELYVYITGALRYCLIKKLVKKLNTIQLPDHEIPLKEKKLKYEDNRKSYDFEIEKVGGILRKSLESLPDKYKIIIQLHYYKGQNLKKISEELGLEYSTVRKRFSRANPIFIDSLKKQDIDLKIVKAYFEKKSDWNI